MFGCRLSRILPIHWLLGSSGWSRDSSWTLEGAGSGLGRTLASPLPRHKPSSFHRTRSWPPPSAGERAERWSRVRGYAVATPDAPPPVSRPMSLYAW